MHFFLRKSSVKDHGVKTLWTVWGREPLVPTGRKPGALYFMNRMESVLHGYLITPLVRIFSTTHISPVYLRHRVITVLVSYKASIFVPKLRFRRLMLFRRTYVF